MIVGYLRSDASVEELQEELDALERAGCERIVVDTAPYSNYHAGMLDAVIKRLSSGDALVVWNLESIANSMPELVNIVLELDDRNVRVRSLAESFDTTGKHRKVLTTILRRLQEFEQQLSNRQNLLSKTYSLRRPGRPRSLSNDDIERARTLLKEGVTIDETARQFHVSRATLYRYL